LYILKTGGKSGIEETAVVLNKTPGEVATAMSLLSRLHLINIDEKNADMPKVPKADEPRTYTADEIAREKEGNPVFSALVDETQRSLGKLLSGNELERLMGIYDSLCLPAEVILQLITHCIAESRGRGDGRMPSMNYIEKAAYTWEREGIFSLESAEEYLKKLENLKSARGVMKQALQITGREFSASEKRYVDEWIALGFDAGSVEIAYDITVLNTGKLSYSYINKIIRNWHDRGFHTAQQIIENDAAGRKSNKSREARLASKTSGSAGLNSDSKFGAPDSSELKRMEQLLRKIKEE
jgi:DnaD/phage-associated family protein